MSEADLDVTVERIGGLTGRATVVARYGTADLPEPEAARIRAAVESLAAARERGAAGEIGADLPGYRVSVGGQGDAAPRVFEVRGDPSADLGGPLKTLLAPGDPDSA
ncbi:hypothetical protein [Actinomadura sp. 21ATH]|uniref:hypothetical protein n=1 Tax=Actinomadura sp. 21ATH TaxID=1735444 RepID=UPI0035C18754